MLAPISNNAENTKGHYQKLFLQNPESEYCSVRVTSSGFTFGNNFGNPQTKSALVRFPKASLKAFLQFANVNVNADTNELKEPVITSLQGVIQVQESFTPWYSTQKPKQNKDGDLILLDGRNVYRNTVLLSDTKAPTYLFGDVITDENGKARFEAGLVGEEGVVEGGNTPITASTAPIPTA